MLKKIVLYVEKVSMIPMDTIMTWTGNAAKTVPESNIGAIEVGNVADLVSLSRNPLDDITVVQVAISTVYKQGTPVGGSDTRE